MKTYSYFFKTGGAVEIEARNRDIADRKFRRVCLKLDLYGVYDVYAVENGELRFIQTQSTNYIKGK
jgi:hypothetical protein